MQYLKIEKINELKNITKTFSHITKDFKELSQLKSKFIENYAELSANDYELHKQLVKEGHNPNEIAKIIRNDEIEKLKEISSQEEFNFNQMIEPSLYERCSFVNQYKVSLIDYAAFFGSIKCFKYLLINGSSIDNTGKYAIAGGNIEIIHLCKQNHSSFYWSYEAAIKLHQNESFKYLYENNIAKTINLNILLKKCITNNSYELFYYLIEKEGMNLDPFINELSLTGNLFIIKCLLKDYQLTNDIFLSCANSGNFEIVDYIIKSNKIGNLMNKIYFNNNMFQNNIWKFFKSFSTAFISASSKGHLEVVKLFIEQKFDINAKDLSLC